MKLLIYLAMIILWYLSCDKDWPKNVLPIKEQKIEISLTDSISIVNTLPVPVPIIAQYVVRDSIIEFAKTLIGVPYKYNSTDPAQGFDCSGFITYVFNHFNIKVPRSSVEFTNYGNPVLMSEAKQADLILFTGTDSTSRVVGHMGFIVSNIDGEINFIHSTSGKAFGVTITALNNYYMSRFVKVIRVFN